MSVLHELFIAPLLEPYFVKSLLGAGVVAVVSGVVGCLVVLRRMAFLGDALSHAMIAGVAGGYLVMKVFFGLEAHAPGMLLGSLLAAVITVMCIGFVSRVSRVKDDTAIGIMYTGIFAGGVVLVSVFRNYIHIDLMHFIMGDVLAVGNADLWASALSSALVLSIVVLFFRHLQLISFDPVMAASIGMPVLILDYLLTTCVSLVVVSAVSMVGVILVVGASHHTGRHRLSAQRPPGQDDVAFGPVRPHQRAGRSVSLRLAGLLGWGAPSCCIAPSSSWWCWSWLPGTGSWPAN